MTREYSKKKKKRNCEEQDCVSEGISDAVYCAFVLLVWTSLKPLYAVNLNHH